MFVMYDVFSLCMLCVEAKDKLKLTELNCDLWSPAHHRQEKKN